MPAANPPSPDPLRIDICGFQVAVSSAHPRYRELSEARYRNFVSSDRAPLDERVEHTVVQSSEAEPHAEAWSSAHVERLEGAIRVTRGLTVGEWRPQLGHCRVSQPASELSDGSPYADAGGDSVLRVVMSFRMLEREMLLVHSAGLVRDGKGYLFVGESDAGKSTVARLSSEWCTVLSDDLVGVGLDGPGARVYGTPFIGEFATGGVNESAPLAGLYFLSQAPSNSLRAVTTGDAVRRLMRSVLYFGADRPSREKVLDLVTELCSRVPTGILEFRPDPSFWEVIHEGL